MCLVVGDCTSLDTLKNITTNNNNISYNKMEKQTLTERALDIIDNKIGDVENNLIWAEVKEIRGDIPRLETELNKLAFLREKLDNRLKTVNRNSLSKYNLFTIKHGNFIDEIVCSVIPENGVVTFVLDDQWETQEFYSYDRAVNLVEKVTYLESYNREWKIPVKPSDFKIIPVEVKMIYNKD